MFSKTRRSIVSSSHRRVWHDRVDLRKPNQAQSIARDHITYQGRRHRCVSMRPRVRMTLLTGPITAHFFLSRAARGRWNKQGAEGHPHRARVPRRQPKACLRFADSRCVCCAQSSASLRVKLSVNLRLDKVLDTHCAHRCGVHMVPSMCLLPMATNYQWLGGVHYNGSCCIGDGRSQPTVPSVQAHLH